MILRQRDVYEKPCPRIQGTEERRRPVKDRATSVLSRLAIEEARVDGGKKDFEADDKRGNINVTRN